MIMQTDGILI